MVEKHGPVVVAAQRYVALGGCEVLSSEGDDL